MISRLARLQVMAFLLLSAIGVTYVGVRYVGLGAGLLGGRYTVHMELSVTGGIFPNAAVTYRGVPVGRVGAVSLHGAGVRVDLRLDRSVRVPTDLTAVVAQRSAVGEQYVDLRPNRDTGPYLRDGDTIPRARTGTPLPVETLLSGLDSLVGSVGAEDLSIVVDELGRAFEGNEAALRTLLDANSALLAEADRTMPQTLALIRDGRTVLETQARSADAVARWSASLARLAAQVRAADPDLRRLLAAGPPAAAELTRLLRDLDPSIGTLLGNLVTVNGIAVRRLAGIEQLLVVFPIAVAGGATIVPGDGTAHLGLVVNLSDPPACNYTRSGTRQSCTAAERAGGSNVRGADNAPGAGRAPAPSVAGYDPGTGLVLDPDGQPVAFGGSGGQYRLAGDQSWKQLLLAGLAP
jgi:phospholipid/cholesterol/gamma-HCH transport system substrate-binding protein